MSPITDSKGSMPVNVGSSHAAAEEDAVLMSEEARIAHLFPHKSVSQREELIKEQYTLAAQFPGDKNIGTRPTLRKLRIESKCFTQIGTQLVKMQTVNWSMEEGYSTDPFVDDVDFLTHKDLFVDEKNQFIRVSVIALDESKEIRLGLLGSPSAIKSLDDVMGN